MRRFVVSAVVALWLGLLIIPLTVFAIDSSSAIQAPLAVRSLLLGGCVKDNNVWVVGERGHIMISTDLGANWAQAESVPSQATLTSVYFINDRLGWAVGHEAVVLRTLDGGQNWQKIFSAPELDQPLLDVWFENTKHGIAIGAYGYFLETFDGGENWKSRYISEDDWHLNGLGRLKNGKLFIVGEAGSVYRSLDNGVSWTTLATPYEGSFHGILPLDGDSLVIFGLRGHIYRSDDAGNSWQELKSGVEALLTGATLLGDGRLVLTGVAGTVLISNLNITKFTTLAVPDRRSLAGVIHTGKSLTIFGKGGITTLAIPELDTND